MSFLDSILGIFKRKPALPTAPKPNDAAVRIYLRADQLVWKTMEDVHRAVGDKATVTGKTVNLKGAVLSGKKLPHPSDSQDENAAALVILIPGFTLRNGWVDDFPGGNVVKVPFCNFEQLKYINIGEDALSTVGEGAHSIQIDRCEFWNDAGGDKSIQLNQAKGATVSNTRIVGGITGIRVQKDSYNTKDAVAILRQMTFEGCETGINAAGKATVKLQSATFKSVKKKWVLNNGAKVIQS